MAKCWSCDTNLINDNDQVKKELKISNKTYIHNSRNTSKSLDLTDLPLFNVIITWKMDCFATCGSSFLHKQDLPI